MAHDLERFEGAIRVVTEPVEDQYPRPWMTKLTNPLAAEVFIVGDNQAKTFKPSEVGSHNDYLDALFNRNGKSCVGLYEKVTKGILSPTRRNINRLSGQLEKAGISTILETNVICYSAPHLEDLHELMDKLKRQLMI